jgi:hypothetical protein
MKNSNDGLGRSVPPSREHVLIYFSQKGIAASSANYFYDHCRTKKWRTETNRKISNWKQSAWLWILNKT